MKCQVPPSATPPSLRSQATEDREEPQPPCPHFLWRKQNGNLRKQIPVHAKIPEAACVELRARTSGFVRLVQWPTVSCLVPEMDGRRREGRAPTPARRCWAYPAPDRRPCLLPTPSAQALPKKGRAVWGAAQLPEGVVLGKLGGGGGI